MTAIEVVLDYETASGCDLKAAGAWRYSEDPTTEILSLTYQIGDDKPRLWKPGDYDEELLWAIFQPACIFIAHNAGFEKAIWRNVMMKVYGYPDVPNDRWHDTMAAAAEKAIPQDLDRVLMVLRLPYQKDKEGSALAKAMSKANKRGMFDRSPEVLQRIYDYNLSDIHGEVALHRRLGWQSRAERAVWLLDQTVNERGVRLDTAYVAQAIKIVERGSAPLLREFAELTHGLKPTQVQKLLTWCHRQNVHLDNLKAETLKELLGEPGDETEELSNNHVDIVWDAALPEDVERALRIRQLIGSASIKKLYRMEKCVCADGRARGLLQYHGTGPGLWAGRLFQPQNFPRGTIQVMTNGKLKAPPPQAVVDAIMTGDPDYVEAMIGPAVQTVVHGLRHTIVAAPGHALIAGDFAGIQARAVLALAGQHDKTALMASGADVYIDMACSIYKMPTPAPTKDAIEAFKAQHPEERQTGKNSVLGLGFQMGAAKFRMRYAKEHPLAFAENVVRVYRKEWAPMVPRLWYGLDDAAVRAVWDRAPQEAYGIVYQLEDGWLTARLPSGRKIWYFNPKPIRKRMPWSTDDNPDIRCAWQSDTMKMGQWRTRDMFGGLLTENVIMGIQRDLLTTAMFKCEKEGLPVILNVHDEIITETETSRADATMLKQIMQDIPEWARAIKLPVSVEAWAGDRYKK